MNSSFTTEVTSSPANTSQLNSTLIKTTTKTPFVSSSSSDNPLSTAEFVGIFIGIAAFVLIVSFSILFYLKRSQFCKNAFRHEEEKSNNKSEKNACSSVNETNDTIDYEDIMTKKTTQMTETNDTNEYENIDFQGEYEEFDSTTNFQADKNVARKGFESATRSATVSDSAANIQWDGFPWQQINDNVSNLPQDIGQNGACLYAKPNKKRGSEITNENNKNNLYDYVETGFNHVTSETVYDEAN